MGINNKVATVFGGSGFVGRQIVRELAARGITVKVATRVPERAYFLRPAGTVGQIVPFQCDPSDVESVNAAVSGADYVVNCIGVLFEKGSQKNGRQRFQNIHAELPAVIASACTKAGVKRFVHISALGVEQSTSNYAKTKLEGEKAVLSNFPGASILRPSVIFGEDDAFFNMFAKMAQISPVLPLIGGGQTKFQPVFVGDVADAAIAALENPKAQGQIYELGGPEIVTFKEIYERMFEHTRRKRCLINTPFWLAKIQAFFMGVLPHPPLTRDQVESLKTDNMVSDSALGLNDLALTPTSMDVVLPRYLERYRAGGRFADLKNA